MCEEGEIDTHIDPARTDERVTKDFEVVSGDYKDPTFRVRDAINIIGKPREANVTFRAYGVMATRQTGGIDILRTQRVGRAAKRFESLFSLPNRSSRLRL